MNFSPTSGIPLITVGLCTRPEIRLVLKGTFTVSDIPNALTGECVAKRCDSGVALECGGRVVATRAELTLEPLHAAHSFVIKDVLIGIQFHWQRAEDQEFVGSLRLVCAGENVVAVNIIDIERYLASVISSEMSAESSLPLLKAHAVASRSWLVAQLERCRSSADAGAAQRAGSESETERIRWYGREEHELFDVCADDHCQRYQGITKATTPSVQQAVEETRGVVLTYGGAVCDARFSKCCGGVTEEFQNVWEPIPVPYLSSIVDDDSRRMGSALRLARETQAEQWIRSSPPAYCNTSDRSILSQVLLDYDRETTSFYRWRVAYTQDELAGLVHQRTGIDFGAIVALEPIERGASGRLVRLNIVGTKRTMTIGKELEIRRTLSPSHLYSSAFVVDALPQRNGVPSRFVLHGAGWGHGVGLCQIGAAVMGERGFSHKQILSHYFPNTKLDSLYR